VVENEASTAQPTPAGYRKRSSVSSATTTALRRPTTLTLNPQSSHGGGSRSPSPGPRGESLGLQTIYQPAGSASLDIIFVHGLGGHSEKTWCKQHRPENFWPSLWLPQDPDVGKARIFTFGYNANFRSGSSKNMSNISDFSKELLYEMGLGRDEYGEGFEIGRVPIIFVAHSLGGLVVKKAYLLGQNDEKYKDIIRSISGIIFLATPHRGSNLAETLNRVLSVTFQYPKSFILELTKGSSTLEEVNEQFRHVAQKLEIISFYEKFETAVGPKKFMIVEKDSSILGYAGEVSRPLDADHHDVCKFSSPQDSNYLAVRNALKSLCERFRLKGTLAIGNQTSEEATEVQKLLAISQTPEEDFNSLRKRWLPGTCDWILQDKSIKMWLEDKPESRIAWFSAPPASGKSILSTHVITHLQELGHACQYFYFHSSDQDKRSISMLLRAIAFQMARDIPAFRRQVLEYSGVGLRLEKTDASVLWQKIYETILFKMELRSPVYWVIDALDEADSPRILLDLLHDISRSWTPIRVLIVSRKTEPLSNGFDRLAAATKVDFIHQGGHLHNTADIRHFAEKEVKFMRGSDELKQEVMRSILNRAQGNFLWVRLVLEDILSCDSELAIQEALEEIPDNMNILYQRMEQSIIDQPKNAKRILAKTLLEWSVCARRPLTLGELAQTLKSEHPEFLDLRRTILDVCRQFLVVDDESRVTLVHQTAREYLVKHSSQQLSIDVKETHGRLFMKTIAILLDPKLRPKITQGQNELLHTDPFVFYAATSWTYHLRQTAAASDQHLDILTKFFRGSSVLVWIQFLAWSSQLEMLVMCAKALTTFVKIRRQQNAHQNPLLHRLNDLELLDSWTIDLVKVVGKFSRHLLSNPGVIYNLIPALCPHESILYRQFSESASSKLIVSGMSFGTWDDNLARISLGNDEQAWHLACAGQYLAVLNSTGATKIWDSSVFTEILTLQHLEPVTAICFNQKGSKFVSYGMRSTKLWSIPSGELLKSAPNPSNCKAMTISFVEDDTKILIGSDDKIIRHLDTATVESGWEARDRTLLKDDALIEGTFINAPMYMSFNSDSTQIGVSYRGFPLSVWSTSETRLIGRCKRSKEFRADRARPSASWFAVDRFTWNPVTGHVIGCYKDGCVFKWHPVTDENQEAVSSADEVAASADGKLFATTSSNGTIKVWNFAFFSVVYQLSSGDLITGFTFSPDCKRFYDIRGSSINAWEPNSLIRLSENEEMLSDTVSEHRAPVSISHVSEESITPFEPVCALAAARRSTLYCAGNEEGTVTLLSTSGNIALHLASFSNFLSVDHLIWGEDGRHVVASDLSGDILVKRLLLPKSAKGKTEVQSMASPKIQLESRTIHQMLLKGDSKLLLICSQDRGDIWSLQEETMHCSQLLQDDVTRIWLNHPYRDDTLLAFGGSDVKMFRWTDLKEIARLRYGDSGSSPDTSDDSGLSLTGLKLNQMPDLGLPKLFATGAMRTQDLKHVLVKLSEGTTLRTPSDRFLVFKDSAFKLDSAVDLPYLPVPDEITASVNIALGVLPGSRLVFLDHDLWVCTYRLGFNNDNAALTLHFFIPRDWVSTEGLTQCCILEDGTFLCPRDGEVAVLKSDIGITDF
jgi:WD40 repeat protein/pimeloyl-ACP methyl ester carboxylesterase